MHAKEMPWFDQGVKAHVHVETDRPNKYKAAKEFNVRGEEEESNHATCYIEARLGKRFVVKLSNSTYNVHAILYVDGQKQVRLCALCKALG